MKVLLEKKIKGTRIKVIEGDITQMNVGAIVNAANCYLSHGGGVAGAIVRAGGQVIQEESDKIINEKGPLQTGEAVITTGGKLKAKYIIHTVGPKWGEGEEERKLEKAINSVLEIALQKEIKSIAIPAISCGIFGFPKEIGTRIITDTLLRYIENHETYLEDVYLIGLGNDISTLFMRALENA